MTKTTSSLMISKKKKSFWNMVEWLSDPIFPSTSVLQCVFFSVYSILENKISFLILKNNLYVLYGFFWCGVLILKITCWFHFNFVTAYVIKWYYCSFITIFTCISMINRFVFFWFLVALMCRFLPLIKIMLTCM